MYGGERLEAIEVIDRSAGTTSRRDTAALFVLIGADATTDWLPPEVARDSHGFILTGTDAMKAGHWTADREPFALETSVPGIFAVGDVRSGSVSAWQRPSARAAWRSPSSIATSNLGAGCG